MYKFFPSRSAFTNDGLIDKTNWAITVKKYKVSTVFLQTPCLNFRTFFWTFRKNDSDDWKKLKLLSLRQKCVWIFWLFLTVIASKVSSIMKSNFYAKNVFLIENDISISRIQKNRPAIISANLDRCARRGWNRRPVSNIQTKSQQK